MSKTGTGTQADPYIVDTWADLVTAVGNSNAYVEVDTTTVNTWDFPKIVEGGLTKAVTWNAASVNGNGLTIKGLYGSNIQHFFMGSSTTAKKYVYNINFLDFNKSSDITAVFNKFEYYNFGNCQFSGVVDGGYFVNRVTTSSSENAKTVFTTGVLGGTAHGCSFALHLVNGAKFCNADYVTIQHGNMNFNCDTPTVTQSIELHESKITGDFPFLNFTNSGGGQNVIDADISAIGTWSNTSGVTLINTDKLASGLTVPTGFTGVTSAQMLDVDALAAVGFTAYPEEEPEGGEGE